MKAAPGYYSLIQYCPDLSRLETVNVGVVLFCPTFDFLDVRTASSNDKPRALFGSENVNRSHLNAAKAAIENRLKNNRSEFQDIADLERFVRTRANDLLLTTPRPMKVFEPKNDLDRLFADLVGGRSRHDRKTPAFPVLDAFFRKLQGEKRARLDFLAKIPKINRAVTVPYAYRNGVWNLVKPQVFPESERKAQAVAMCLAAEGDLLARLTRNTPDPSRLVVITKFAASEATDRIRDDVQSVFQEYRIESVAENSIEEYTSRVASEAHEWGEGPGSPM